MEACKKYLKIASIILIANGALFSLFVMKYSVFLMFVGAYLWYVSTLEEEGLQKNKIPLIIVAIVFMILNFIAGIFIILAIDKISSINENANSIKAPPLVKKIKVVDPEVKKIDTLLKLGVSMVLISGILLATTSWDFISEYGKLFFLLLFAGIFFGLSLFAEKKLKLYGTSFMYWILSMSFLLLIIVAVLYFEIAGPMITYSGIGSNIAYGITFFTVAGLSLATYLKYGKEQILYWTYSTMYLSIACFLNHYVDSTTVLLVLSALFLVINTHVDKKSVLFKITKIASYIILLGIFTCNRKEEQACFLLLTFIIVENHYYLSSLTNKGEEKIPSLWISHILVPIAISNCSFLNDYAYLIIFLLGAIYALLMKENLITNDKQYKGHHFFLYTALSILCIFLADFSSTIGLLIATLYVATNFLLELENPYENSMGMEPLTIGLFMISFFAQSFINFNVTFIFTLICMIYCILHFTSKGKRRRNYWIYSIIAIIISFVTNTIDHDNWISLMMFIPSIYLFMSTKYDEDKKEQTGLLVFTYMLVLYTVYNFFYVANFFDLSTVISSIMVIWILGMMIIVIDDEKIKKLNYFAIIVPLLMMIGEVMNTTVKIILTSLIIQYATFLIIKFYTTKKESKNTIGIIGIIISILYSLSSTDPIIGLYIGIVGIITVMIGYYKSEYKSFFNGGIIIIIVNIILQLWDLWEQIPFSIYLLIAGLALIGFVTYKEMHNKK